MKYKLVEIKWEDHCSYPGWHSEKDVPKKPVVNSSIGYVVNKSDELIVLAQTVIEEIDTIGEILCIMPRDILSIKELRSK